MNTKYFFVAVFLIALVIQAYACNFKTDVVFENKSERKIDSVVFHLNNYKFNIKDIKPNEEKRQEIMSNQVTLNNHDVIFRAYIYEKDSLLRHTNSYNDLSGSLVKNYTLILNKDLTTKIIIK